MIAIRKLLSAVAAASLLATGSLAGAASLGGAQTLPTAAAQVDDPPATVDGIPGTGNLHVHKRIGLPDDLPSDGRQETGALPGAPAEGINFSVYQVRELNEPEEWLEVQGLDPADAMNQVNLEAPFRGLNLPTDSDGVVTFPDLPRGLYLVVEEDNPVTKAGQATAPVAPFLVAVPLTDPAERQTWLEDVYVYPKNQAVESVVKQVTDSPAHVGDQIGYEISGAVPETPAGALSGFSITDKLPAELGAPRNVTVTINGTTAAEDTGYYNVSTWEVEEDGALRNVLLVQLTDAGIVAASEGADRGVEVNFNAVVEETPQTTLDNLAWISPTDLGARPTTGWNPGVNGPNPGTKSNETRSIYGQIKIAKTGQGDDAEGLGGAVFELHRCTDAGDVVTAEPIAVGGEEQDDRDQRTTAANGEALFSGIHLANVQNQDTPGGYDDLWEDNGDQFCLVETRAPEGYELLPAPVLVTTMDYDETTVQLVNAKQDIENVEANVGAQLPLTGGIGIWAILGIGVLLLLAAAAYYLANRKRDA